MFPNNPNPPSTPSAYTPRQFGSPTGGVEQVGPQGAGMLRVVTPEQLTLHERDAANQKAADELNNQPMITGLAAYIKRCWDAARTAKMPIEQIMLKAKRQRIGEYDPEKKAQIGLHGGSDVYMMVTEVKCRAAESWVRDILMDEGSPPWDLQATPIPDLNPMDQEKLVQKFADKMTELAMSGMPFDEEELRTVTEQEFKFALAEKAQRKADAMALKIKDQFAEGGWYEAFNDFVTDLVTYPAAIVKAPVVRRAKRLAWEVVEGKTKVVVKEDLVPQYERVDPFRFYPEPGITRIKDGYCFEHHKLSRSDLAELKGAPGYSNEAISTLLATGPGASWFLTGVEIQQNELERKFTALDTPTDTYDALEFWGKISGRMLIDFGLDEQLVEDPDREYDACVWTVGNYVIKAVINYDPLGEKPYAKTSFYRVPGAFWGKGIPEVIEDIQGICNAAARALVNNMGVASGPQVDISIDRLAAGEEITQMHPWKIWQTKDGNAGTSQAAIKFFQPNDNSNALMAVFEKFSTMADEHSGIPGYVSGDISVTGAGRTSSGLSMLMASAGKSIRQVISYIDNDITKVVVTRQFVYNMRYLEDESIKGDVIVVPRGSVNLAVKDTITTRRVEFLNATANPLDAQIMGMEGRASVLREVAKSLNMPNEEVVPSKEKMRFNQAVQQMQPPTTPADPQAEKATPALPDGSPAGGQAANLVSSKITGQP